MAYGYRRYRRSYRGRRYWRRGRAGYYRRARILRSPSSFAGRRGGADFLKYRITCESRFAVVVPPNQRYTSTFSAVPFIAGFRSKVWTPDAGGGDYNFPIPSFRDDSVHLALQQPRQEVIDAGGANYSYSPTSWAMISTLYDSVKVASATCTVSLDGFSTAFATGQNRPRLHASIDRHHDVNGWARWRFPVGPGSRLPYPITVQEVDALVSPVNIFGSTSAISKNLNANGSNSLTLRAVPDDIVQRATYKDCDFNIVTREFDPEHLLPDDDPSLRQEYNQGGGYFNPRFDYVLSLPYTISSLQRFYVTMRMTCILHFKDGKYTGPGGYYTHYSPRGVPLNPDNGPLYSPAAADAAVSPVEHWETMALNRQSLKRQPSVDLSEVYRESQKPRIEGDLESQD